MRAMTLAGLLLLSPAAHAGPTLEARYGLGAGGTDDRMAPLVLDQNVAITPFLQGPRLELALSHTLLSPAHQSVYGLGLRQPLGDALSIAGHGALVSRWGESVDYRSAAGLQGALDWALWRGDGIGLGLHAQGGAAPGAEMWWAHGGLGLQFGGRLGG